MHGRERIQSRWQSEPSVPHPVSMTEVAIVKRRVAVVIRVEGADRREIRVVVDLRQQLVSRARIQMFYEQVEFLVVRISLLVFRQAYKPRCIADNTLVRQIRPNRKMKDVGSMLMRMVARLGHQPSGCNRDRSEDKPIQYASFEGSFHIEEIQLFTFAISDTLATWCVILAKNGSFFNQGIPGELDPGLPWTAVRTLPPRPPLDFGFGLLALDSRLASA